ncbi:SDR family oxidoreductase [Halorhodospira halophila]|uniref:NAD-dependent epimerase/dehydratase n=1 Tax=Halorhodospira halophila (strain DSM 244 / SL1) TaxID=349124 RepID=A1WVX9_HALHL|nr:SDR family oxidoreductase [Halorhodospira halophila]ABM61841.1 NAD-dependent epimerase/dehydratase [Halorhodospira halophila SL1]MBK1728831.1 NAD(P)-dependent oxidoreductase [Halorhodospira halophila]
MRVLIIGAHGQVGRRLVERLAPSRHEVRAMVRDPDQQPALAAAGATETVVADLERDCSQAVRGTNAVVFTAGSGPHTGTDKTEAVDRRGALRIIDLAEAAGVDRFLMVSSMRTECPEEAPERLRPYLDAKREADERLRNTAMDWTILRPGRLLNERARGKVSLGEGLPYGEIPRDDVAALLAALIDAEAASRRTLDAVSGETAVREAVRRLGVRS